MTEASASMIRDEVDVLIYEAVLLPDMHLSQEAQRFGPRIIYGHAMFGSVWIHFSLGF